MPSGRADVNLPFPAIGENVAPGAIRARRPTSTVDRLDSYHSLCNGSYIMSIKKSALPASGARCNGTANARPKNSATWLPRRRQSGGIDGSLCAEPLQRLHIQWAAMLLILLRQVARQ